MDVKLIIDGYELKVGIELLERIANYIADDDSLQDLYQILAKSKSASIRSEIAYKECISEETVALLLNDNDSLVLERILHHDIAKEIMSEEMLDRVLAVANEDTLKRIVRRFDGYENIHSVLLSDKLIALGNPSVTLEVAKNSSTPKKVLKELLKDSDPDIARVARKTLERY